MDTINTAAFTGFAAIKPLSSTFREPWEMKARSGLKSCRAGCILYMSILAIFALSVLPSNGQTDTTSRKQHEEKSARRYLSLFENDEILEVSLEFDYSTFLKKPDKNQSFDGIMTFHFSETDTLDRKVTIQYRGQSRYERCRLPPIRIIFRQPVYEVSDSSRIKKMKLVNQCQPGALYDDYIIKEYLVYKLYSVLTDTCFRVRLLKVSYIDTEKKKKPVVQYGIFIEPEELLAKRTNMLEVKTKSLTQKNMHPLMIDRIAIFNYMVANWDWSVPGQHNISVFSSLAYDNAGLGIPVPFDFDLTGVVNADYAIPPPGIGIETNRDRMFTGICRTREVYMKELMMFLDKKDEFYSVVDNYPQLSKASKRDIINFLDQFFLQLEKPRSLDNLIDLLLEECKQL
jgi:hypothetical protein